MTTNEMAEALIFGDLNYQSVTYHCAAINDERRRVTVIHTATGNKPRKCTLCNILPYKDAIYFSVKELPSVALQTYHIVESDAIVCDLYNRTVNDIRYTDDKL